MNDERTELYADPDAPFSEKILPLLHKLRNPSPARQEESSSLHTRLCEQWRQSGVNFATSTGKLESRYREARRQLMNCIVPTAGLGPILHEGGTYFGCWLESTGTINTEVLARFLPEVAENTYRGFAAFQREDGLLPYKITAEGPSYRQIQLVTPLARSVWNYSRLHEKETSADTSDFLPVMYEAMRRYDRWIGAYRDTRGTGCVEAFGTFDTGHDLSPRFWHVPDVPYRGDAAACDPHSPLLPFLAPDLTANIFCQRTYLSKIADRLEYPDAGQDWLRMAEQSLDSLYRHCFDEQDGFFYDRDRHDQWVRVQSDVLLRVLACEVGDGEFFAETLRRYLLNTSKFFAKYPLTSIAMDDPRFDPFIHYNSWSGPTNFLTILRTPHAFEHHRRHVELSWVLHPILSAFARSDRFAQCLSPWTGEMGFTEQYSPSILALLDIAERLCGILPQPDRTLAFTGLLPSADDHGEEIAGDTAYSRTVDGIHYELVNTPDRCFMYKNGRPHLSFPYGLRIVTDRAGYLRACIGMSVQTVRGVVRYDNQELEVVVKGNEIQEYEQQNPSFRTVGDPGIAYPSYG